jgi:hypothetical protein
MRSLKTSLLFVLGLVLGLTAASLAAEFEVVDILRVDGYAVMHSSVDITGSRFSVGGSTLSAQYGKVGIGTAAPSFLLQVSSAAGADGDLVVISTGSSNVIRMTGKGEIYANKYYGDGSGLTGITVGDNLGDHIATTTLQMGAYGVTSSSSVSAAYYQISGSTVLAVGTGSLDVGIDAGRLSTGNNNSFVGYQAGYSNTTGGYNSFVGSYAGLNNTGDYNSFVGNRAGYANSSGSSNSFLGNRAGHSNTTGSFNSILGSYAGYTTQTGSANTVLGYSAGYGSASGSFSSSTIIGYMAGNGLTTGGDNIFLGWRAGYIVTSGTGNIVMGYDQDVSAPTANNELNIGGLLYGDLSAKTIGISTRIPQAALDIVSTGTAANIYAQIWRNGSGVVVASMTSQGALYATLPPGSGDNLGDHTATKALNMSDKAVDNVSSITITGTGVTGSAPLLAVAGSTMVVLNNGNVGIGTVSPSDKLEVNGAIRAGTFIHGTNSGSARIGRSDDGSAGELLVQLGAAGSVFRVVDSAWTKSVMRVSNDAPGDAFVVASAGLYTATGGLYTNSSIPLLLGTNSSENVRIDTSGKVGIGVTPSEKLDVNGAIRVGAFAHGANSGNARIGRPDDGASGEFVVQLGAAGSMFRIVDTSWSRVIANISSDAPGNSLVINAAGNMGVGTLTPDQRLTVTGNISQTGSIISSGTGNNYFAGNVGISTGAPQARLDVLGVGTLDTDTAQIWRNSAGTIVSSMSSSGKLYPQPAGDNLGNHVATTTLNMAGFDVINASSITVAATKPGLTVSTNLYVMNGSVGIGTAAPGAKLQINGSVRVMDRDQGDGIGDFRMLPGPGTTQTHFYHYDSDGRFAIHKYGTGSAAGEVFTVSNTGNVGIGSTTPSAPLTIYSPTTLSNAFIISTGTETSQLFTVSTSGVVYAQALGAGNGAFWGRNTSTGSEGFLGYGNWGVYCSSGSCGGLLGWTNTSDGRLKTGIRPIRGALAKILQLDGVYYRWKDPQLDKTQGEKVGLIAQDVERVFPQAVTTDTGATSRLPGGTKMLSYADLVGPLISAVKELNRKIEEKDVQIAVLKKAVCEINPKAAVCGR